jgi:hypothetical protein
MTKEYLGHLYETHPDWHTVVARKCADWMDEIIMKSRWLNEYCPDADLDYDAYVHHDDQLIDHDHRTVYFFRDPQVAVLFALRWG